MKNSKHFIAVAISLLLIAVISNTQAQTPQLVNYQAVARLGSGELIAGETTNIRIAIIHGDITPIILWEEQHEITTNDYGLITLRIGDAGAAKTDGTLSSFSEINWSYGPINIKATIEYEGTWYEMPSSPVVSVPYALMAREAEIGQIPENGDTLYIPTGSLAIGTDSPGGSKLSVVSDNDLSEEALFEVKRADGQTIFAVYNDAVRMYVSNGDGTKGPKGGFSIGGFDRNKSTYINDLLWITPDSIRMYINDEIVPDKGPKGGFSIGGFDRLKAGSQEFLRVTDDSTRIYIPEGDSKGPKGGFSIGGFDRLKGAVGSEYFNVSGQLTANTVDSASQIMWYPLKEALIAGRVHIGSADSVGFNSTALGHKSIAMGDYSQAFGYKASAIGNNSTAVGNNANAEGDESYAFGNYAMAQDTGSYAIGSGATASGLRSFAMGSTGVDSAGVGTFPTTAAGDYAYAFGNGSEAIGRGAFAFGVQNSAIGDFSLAMGYNTTASNWYSTTMGRETTASGFASTASGYESLASGSFSTTIGYNTTASDDCSTAMGYHTIASGHSSTAMGHYSTASGFASTATGVSTQATGTYSTAMGWETTASGDVSTAMGYKTKASGKYSTAMGVNTIARSYMSYVIGWYNDTLATSNQTFWGGQDPLFIIGNGHFADDRHNAVLVKKNGEVYFPDVYEDEVGATNRDLFIDNSGKIGYVTSSIKYKTNVNSIENIDWLYDLNPVTFNYKRDETNTLQYGLIAEEVEEVNPLFVSYNDKGEVETVLYSRLATPMLKALQEQQVIIEEKERRITDLEDRLNNLEAIVSGLLTR